MYMLLRVLYYVQKWLKIFSSFYYLNFSNNIEVDPGDSCHFSGKPSTTRLSKAKYLCSAWL